MSKSKRSVLVAGAQGVIGRTAAEYFGSLPGTKVYGLSRRPLEEVPGATPVNIDLL
jgi:NAD(P)-dependent dehydrogenase (short-subunit alcohol dehydrogenase family)